MFKLNAETKIATVVLIVLIILLLMPTKSKTELNIEAFNDNKTLICYNTLIVTNSNWKLSEDHLINNNSAGFVKIRDCKVKYEN
jgi:hypothetical protein